MAFKKYNVKDNAFSTLLVGISASATSLEVQASEGAKFPPSNFIATLVQYETSGDETSAVLKREKVLVSNNATDTFTITRGFDGDTPVSFNPGDFVYLNMVSEITEDMQTEIARLETDKLDTTTYNSTTRDGLTAYRLLYIDGNGNETQLALGTAGQVLISQGATSNPVWQSQSTDINGLTLDSTLASDDEIIFYNKSALENQKRVAKASEQNPGLVEKATQAEMSAGTADKYPDAATIGAVYGLKSGTASDNIAVSNTSTGSAGGSSGDFNVIKSTETAFRGGVRVEFEYRENEAGLTSRVRLYVNGNAVGTELFVDETWQTYSQDISVKIGDRVEVRGYYSDVRNLYLKSDITTTLSNGFNIA